MMEFYESERQPVFQEIDNRTCAAVAAVDHNLQRLQLVELHIVKQVLDIAILPGNCRLPPLFG